MTTSTQSKDAFNAACLGEEMVTLFVGVQMQLDGYYAVYVRDSEVRLREGPFLLQSEAEAVVDEMRASIKDITGRVGVAV